MTIARVAANLVLAAMIVDRGAGAQQLAHLVDDRGKTIAEALVVCFQLGLRSECRQVGHGEEVHTPASFYGLRIEGDGHGPLNLRREELPRLPDGSFQITVARKAVLEIARLAQQPHEDNKPLTVSLYSPRDGTFREPAFRAQLGPGESRVKVPAGEFIASLAVASNAPDLHRITARPAGIVRAEYRRRQGWSLIVRCVAGATGRPVSHVDVKLNAASGYGLADHLIAEDRAGTDGLVFFSGIGATLASVAAFHPGLLPARAAGVLAAPGTFGFLQVSLAQPAYVRALVSLHGRPVAGVRCRIADFDPDSSAREKQLWEGNGDVQGVCRTGPLAEGQFKLSVQAPGSTAQVHRWVMVAAGQETEEDIVLAPTRVAGEVRRGGKPAAEYKVTAAPLSQGGPRGSRTGFADQAASREDGKFELTLWTPGTYMLYLKSPSGAPVSAHRELTTAGDEEQRVDFDLGSSSVGGDVTDDQGRPLAEARVGVDFHDLGTWLATDAKGTFQVDLQGAGAAMVTASKAGYLSSDPIEVQIHEDHAASVTVVLKRDDSLRGTLLTASGAPIPGGLVTSIISTGAGPQLYAFGRSESDGTFEVRVPPGPLHVFASGPGCPLFGVELPPAAHSDAGVEIGQPPQLRCPALPASLQVTLLDTKGTPIPHSALILRQQGTIVPHGVLELHLALLGLSPDTDGSGHLVVAGLAPGDYDLFLTTFSSEATIAAGLSGGYLTSVSLPALASTELQLTLPAAPREP